MLPSVRRGEPYRSGNLTWSPNGTQILLTLGFRKGGGLFVMSSRGDELRRLGDAGYPGYWQWSPDGSKIAFERRKKPDRAVLVTLDLASGQERPLNSTSAPGKDAGARFPTTTYNNVAHHWYYEGWTWAPDSRSLLILRDLRTRPWVVDIKTGKRTELPWDAHSMPSWQRVRSG